jgi:hypothetical protein
MRQKKVILNEFPKERISGQKRAANRRLQAMNFSARKVYGRSPAHASFAAIRRRTHPGSSLPVEQGSREPKTVFADSSITAKPPRRAAVVRARPASKRDTARRNGDARPSQPICFR